MVFFAVLEVLLDNRTTVSLCVHPGAGAVVYGPFGTHIGGMRTEYSFPVK